MADDLQLSLLKQGALHQGDLLPFDLGARVGIPSAESEPAVRALHLHFTALSMQVPIQLIHGQLLHQIALQGANHPFELTVLLLDILLVEDHVHVQELLLARP